MVVELFTGPVIITFTLGIFSIILLYQWSIKNHDYWKKRGIPSAKTLPFLGSILDIFRMHMHEMEYQRYNELGLLYGHFEGNKPCLSVADPTLVKEILIKDFIHFANRRQFITGDAILDNMISILEGEDWKRVRSIITPCFTTGKLKRMLSIFKDSSKTLVKNLKFFAETGKPIDIKRQLSAYTMDVIASAAFSTKIDSHNDPDNEFCQKGRKMFNQPLGLKFLLFLAAPKLAKFLRMTPFDMEATKFFKDVTYQIMEERKKHGQVRNDFIHLLMETAKEELPETKSGSIEKDLDDITSNYGEEDVAQQIFRTVTSKHLSLDELVAQCVIFFLAGFEGTASTLAVIAYYLALNPDVQEKLRREVDNTLSETDGKLTYESIQSLKYLDNVISETLRLNPPAPRLERMATSEHKLGESGITIEKGMIVTFPIYAMHRDPKYFPDPEKFDPDRFTSEEKSKRDPYVYLPFGAGPRNCLGMRFALMEIKACLAYIISTFVIKRCPQTKVPLEFFMGQGLMQPCNIFVELESRTDCLLTE